MGKNQSRGIIDMNYSIFPIDHVIPGNIKI